VLDGVPYYRLGGSRKVAVNVRIIAATNRNLEEEVRAGKFRRDLYHRLTQFQLKVPPLRERRDDIVALAEHFLHETNPQARFSEDAVQALVRYDWPGNVRELKNVIFRASIQIKPGLEQLRASDLPAGICGVQEAEAGVPFQGNLNEMEKQMIMRALSQAGGSQIKAAQQLGISSRTLRRKMLKYRREEEASKASASGSAQQERYFRAMVEIPVVLLADGQEIQAKTVNISSGGLAIQTPIPLAHGSSFECSFTLPDLPNPIEAKMKLAWSGPEGLAGLSIVEIHPALQRELQQWLLSKATAEMPTQPSDSSK